MNPEHLLVSFCNPRWPSQPRLGLLSLATGDFRVLRLPGDVYDAAGITGLAASDEYVYAAQNWKPDPPGPPPYDHLLIFDRGDFSLVNRVELNSVAEVHSILLLDRGLLVVSTGSDEIIEVELQGSSFLSQRSVWRPDPQAPRADVHHINSIVFWRGDLWVTGFGGNRNQEGEPPWTARLDGFVRNVWTGETLATGLAHPHSLVSLGDRLALCESAPMRVAVLGDQRCQQLDGYTRGLCVVGDKLYVGASVRRRVSKSTGHVSPAGGSLLPTGGCTVSRLSLESFEVEQSYDLSAYAPEIYDLLPISDVEAWPVLAELEWRDDALVELRSLCDERLGALAQLRTEVAARDAEIGRLRDELASLEAQRAGMAQEIERLRSA